MATKTVTREKRSHQAGRYVLVGSTMRKVPAGFIACRAADIPSCVHDAPRTTVFISSRRSSTDDLLKAGLERRRGSRIGELLTLEPPRPESVPSLSGLFERVIGAIPGYRWLPIEELATVVSGKDPANRFIGGAADSEGKTLALVRGNLATLVVPFVYFEPSGNGTKPDFSKLAFTDYGLTVALGEYEASADGILYEFDPVYRQRLNKERRESERDFAPLTPKTIARIERNEVAKPHGKTLETLAKRLGVSPDQIESY
jgi:hypothetical protein